MWPVTPAGEAASMRRDFWVTHMLADARLAFWLSTLQWWVHLIASAALVCKQLAHLATSTPCIMICDRHSSLIRGTCVACVQVGTQPLRCDFLCTVTCQSNEWARTTCCARTFSPTAECIPSSTSAAMLPPRAQLISGASLSSELQLKGRIVFCACSPMP